LRERKKARTRTAIQTHALRLFRDQGYDATTVQQIIDEADVSESTFFRYFPTKADLVLADEFDPLIAAAFRAQPPDLSAIQAFRAAFRATFAQMSDRDVAAMRDRIALIEAVPQLRGTLFDQSASTIRVLAEVVAERVGRQADDLAVRTLAGAIIGASISIMFAVAENPSADLAALFDEALQLLEAGLVL
jgi:AcrR family transcriptional regulator